MAQLSVIVAAIMLYYFVRIVLVTEAGRCQAQSSFAREKHKYEQIEKSVL